MNICVVLFLLFYCRRNGGCVSAPGNCGCGQSCVMPPTGEVCRPSSSVRPVCGCESSHPGEENFSCRRIEPACCNARIRSCEEGCGCQEVIENTEEECAWKFKPDTSFNSCSSTPCPIMERQDDVCTESRNGCCR